MTENEVNCLECRHCDPYEVLIGIPDWHCLKYNQDMSIETIGDHFSCKAFRKKVKK